METHNEPTQSCISELFFPSLQRTSLGRESCYWPGYGNGYPRIFLERQKTLSLLPVSGLFVRYDHLAPGMRVVALEVGGEEML